MSQFFLNPALLAGLVGLSLPVMAHLLSRRKYDVVEWGAMQFLEMGKKTKRKIQLEELLLLLVRMALILLVVLALARPWISSGWLGSIASGQSRDVVFVIDGSYSMGFEGTANTPHDRAREFARRFLRELNPGDSITLIDARDQPRVLLDGPTRDFRRVREALDTLPDPSGSSRLADAVAEGVRLLTTTENLSREVVVLSDRQQKAWLPDDTVLWTQLDDRLADAGVRPRLWVVDVGSEAVSQATNFYLEEITISREATVPELPVILRTTLSGSGSDAAATRAVSLLVDGQPIPGRKQVIPVEPGTDATLEFEYAFPAAGSHVLTLRIDEDNLPGDNSASAAVVVQPAIPVLLIDGDPDAAAANRETRFMQNALTPTLNPNPWVDAEAVRFDDWTDRTLEGRQVVVLANVPSLTEAQAATLRDFVARGGGLLFATGDLVKADEYGRILWEEGEGLLPALPQTIENAPPLQNPEQDDADDRSGIYIADESLDLPWMQRFQRVNDGGLTDARFTKWWTIKLPARDRVLVEENEDAEAETQTVRGSQPVVAARLTTGDPFLITRRYGRGMTALLTSPVDADWSNLVSNLDYVVLMHELVFRLASADVQRNVDTGMPLILPVEPAEVEDVPAHVFVTPDDRELKPIVSGDELSPIVRLDRTELPGVYSYRAKDDPIPSETEYFVAGFDRAESDLSRLTDDQIDFLTGNERMRFVDGEDAAESLAEAMFADDSRSELWHLLLIVFVGFLLFELLMTRRLVRGGHGSPNPDEEVIELMPIEEEAPLPVASVVESEGRRRSTSARPAPRRTARPRRPDGSRD